LKKSTVFILLQFGFILFLTWLLWQPSNQKTTAVPQLSDTGNKDSYDRLMNRINTLEVEVQQEKVLRQHFTERLSQLEKLTIKSPSSYIAPGKQNDPQISSDSNNEQVSMDSNETSVEQNLIDQGLSVDTVNSIQSYIDSRRLQRLELSNQAIRNGSQDSAEFIEKMNQLNDPEEGIKLEFGEKIYDQYLYASGQPNRVVVREVIGGSTAESAGIQAGDIIISYANNPIYTMPGLREATTNGVAGASTLIELTRNDQPYSLTVARGPLGILMDYTRVKP
jgi:C-terminal processing protease CtpA/Prc